MIISEYLNNNFEEILELYESVGWTNYTNHPERLKRGIKKSLITLIAYEEEKIIGLIRAVGDEETLVLIQDILIRPEYQRRGIGTKLIKKILEKYKNVYQVQLLTDNTERTIKFYESLGFKNGIEIGTVPFIIINV